MKVLNLCCAQGHMFEGWFASESDFVRQQDGGLIACPMCGQTQIQRLPSAPRLNLKRAAADPARAVRAVDEGASPTTKPEGRMTERQPPDQSLAPVATGLEQAWLAAVRQVMAQTEDVGSRFAQEARRMHYGEVEARGIRGQTSPAEAQALREEGIEVLVLPVPDALKGSSH